MLFRDGHAEWVAEFDAGEIQRRLFDIGAFEGFTTEKVGVFGVKQPIIIHRHGSGGDF